MVAENLVLLLGRIGGEYCKGVIVREEERSLTGFHTLYTYWLFLKVFSSFFGIDFFCIELVWKIFKVEMNIKPLVWRCDANYQLINLLIYEWAIYVKRLGIKCNCSREWKVKTCSPWHNAIPLICSNSGYVYYCYYGEMIIYYNGHKI